MCGDDGDGGGDDLSDPDSLFDESMEDTDDKATVSAQDPARRSPPQPESPDFVSGLLFRWPTITIPPGLERQVPILKPCTPGQDVIG